MGRHALNKAVAFGMNLAIDAMKNLPFSTKVLMLAINFAVFLENQQNFIDIH